MFDKKKGKRSKRTRPKCGQPKPERPKQRVPRRRKLRGRVVPAFGQASAKIADLSPPLHDQSSQPTSPSFDGGPKRTRQPPDNKGLPDLIGCFRRWLHLPDPGVLLITLAAVAANYMARDPVWLLLIGASSSGKTEALQSLGGLDHVFRVSVLTEASLLSGTKKSEHAPDAKGGLLKEIGEFGIVIFEDFTSILSMNRDSRQTVLAALREIYDGDWTRCVGSDGGKSLRWKGKIGLIASCTPVIDSHHAVISTMGERFTYYRLPVADSQDAAEQARRAINNVSHVSEMRDQLSTAVKEIFGQFNFNELPSRVESHEQDRLINLAMLACRARSPVERDPIERHVLFTPQPEAPARLAAVLTRLFCGLRTIGVKDELAWKVITKVGFDCVPSPRRELFQGLAKKAENSLSTQSLMAIARCSKTATRRALEELELLGILENVPGVTSKSPDYWALSQQALRCIGVLGEPASQQTGEQAATTNAA